VAVIAVPVVFGYLGLRGGLTLWWAHRRGKGNEFWLKEKRWLTPVIVLNLALALLFAYGRLWESSWVERVEVQIGANIRSRIRIVHLSDLHLEGWGQRESLAIELTNGAEPDLVLLTGDYISKGSGDAYVADLRRFLSKLQSKAGVFAVPGNWDTNAPKWFEGTGVTLLGGKTALVDANGVKVAIAGEWFDMAPPLKDTAADLTVYLQHSPDFLEEAAKAGYDLYLAGHTHGGQVRIPGFGAVVTLSRHCKKYESGLFREGATYLYVNRGLGLEGGWAPRVRLFCRPEVTVIDVVPGSHK
jgi:predicted MPP superfamily phosphohydrolase